MIAKFLLLCVGLCTCFVFEMNHEWPWPSDGVACMAVSRESSRAISVRVYDTWDTAYFDSCWVTSLHGNVLKDYKNDKYLYVL